MIDYKYIHFAKHKLYLLTGIIVSIIIVFLSVSLASKRTSWFGRAQVPSSALLSLENSYLFASPISASADGKSIIRITVFILNSQGIGIPSQEVKLKTSGPVTVSSVQPITDEFGRAIFDLTSLNVGNYTIAAEISGALLSQQVSVSFQ